MLRPWVFVGFTGSRKLEQPDLIGKKIQAALSRIRHHTAQAPLAAISSAAKGADTLFVETVVREEVPWVLLLPFAAAEFFNPDDFSPEDLRRIEQLVPKAIRTHVEPPPEAGLPPKEQRVNAFVECSARTVDASDYLIAVWDGQTGKPGGTGGTVAYAREQKKPLVWIHAVTGEITEENFPAPAAAPTPAATAFERHPVDGGLPALQATLNHYDNLALQHGPQARELVTTVIYLHLFATGFGLIAPLFLSAPWIKVFMIVPWITAAIVILKVSALIWAQSLAHRQHQAKGEWLRARIIAELCRSAQGTWHLPYSEKVNQAVAVPGFREWQRTLALWRLIAPPETRGLAAQRDAYAEVRLDNIKTGQIPYFKKQLERAEDKHGYWQRVAHGSTYAAIACGLIVLPLLALHEQDPKNHGLEFVEHLFKYLSLVLPLLSAAVFTWLMSSDCQRRVVRNREMLAYLLGARERIKRATTWSGLERRVAEVETLLLLEVLEWHSVTHFTASAH